MTSPLAFKFLHVDFFITHVYIFKKIIISQVTRDIMHNVVVMSYDQAVESLVDSGTNFQAQLSAEAKLRGGGGWI